MIFFVFFVILSTGTVLADCVCKTSTDAGGNKTCSETKNNCKSGETATCQRNLDGACNHNVFQGASCVCLGPGEDLSSKINEGRDEFCVQEGHGPATSDPWINTALGCVPVRIDSFVEWLLPSLFGVAGGIAFLLMVYGFISLATSGGQPDKVKGAKETITSAITGLVVAIFSLFILRLIAIDILKIPGLI